MASTSGHGHSQGDQHDHGHGHHAHGHAVDQGWSGALRYLRHLPKMWRSPVNEAAVALMAPATGERVVDVGAGMGAGTFAAAAVGASVVAVEPTPFMRRVLTVRRLLSRHRKRVEIVDGTAESVPLPDRSAGAAVAVNSAHHWSDLAAGVTELARTLRPGGRLVIVDEDFLNPEHPSHRSHGDAQDRHKRGLLVFSIESLTEVVESCGLRVERTEAQLADVPVIAVVAFTPTADWPG